MNIQTSKLFTEFLYVNFTASTGVVIINFNRNENKRVTK